MKKVTLSFDDAREDFYSRAFPLIMNYGMTATLNVTTGFLKDPTKFDFPSAGNKPMSNEQVLSVVANGIEVACHGSMHINTSEDVLTTIKELQEIGVDVKNIGFASPSSEITLKNRNEFGIWNLVKNETLSYIRTGIQIRREGLWYTLLSVIDRFVHSNNLFSYLNKHNIINNVSEPFLPSVAIYSYTSVGQIISLINNAPDNSKIILMFHSILYKEDDGYGKDKFYWDIEKFKKLLAIISQMQNTTVCTTKELIK